MTQGAESNSFTASTYRAKEELKALFDGNRPAQSADRQPSKQMDAQETNVFTAAADCPEAMEYVLPIANQQSSVWKEKKIRKGLTRKSIADIYCVKDLLADEEEAQSEFTDYVEEDEETPVNYIVLSGTGAKAQSSRRFAENVGKDANGYRGKRVLGNERCLVRAVQSNPEAVSMGSASVVFSGKGGTVAEGIEVIPYDIDSDGKVSEEERLSITSLSAFVAFVRHSGRLLAKVEGRNDPKAINTH